MPELGAASVAVDTVAVIVVWVFTRCVPPVTAVPPIWIWSDPDRSRMANPTSGPKLRPWMVMVSPPNWDPVVVPVMTGPSKVKPVYTLEAWPLMVTWMDGLMLLPTVT